MKLTKKLRLLFTRALIDSYNFNQPFSKTDAECFFWLTGLPKGYSVMKITNPEYPNENRHVAIDGTAMSWRHAINETSAINKVKIVMREAIASDLRDLKSSVDNVCAICGATSDITVDHKDVSFNSIANEFIAVNSTPEIVDKSNNVGNMFASIDVEAKWIAFHASKATYQILCRSCNSSKGAS